MPSRVLIRGEEGRSNKIEKEGKDRDRDQSDVARAKEYWQLPEAERDKELILLQSLYRKHSPWF